MRDPNALFTYGGSSYSGNEAQLTCLRLFSTSGGSLLTEHFLPPDLAFSLSTSSSTSFSTNQLTTSQQRLVRSAVAARAKVGTTRSLPSNAGTIWSLAPSPLGRFLALGCEGGEVRIVDVSEKETFGHIDSASRFFARSKPASGSQAERERVGVVSRMEKTKGRVMTLAWGPPRRIGNTSSSSGAKSTAAQEKPAKRTQRPAKGDDDGNESDSTVGSSSSSEVSTSSEEDDDNDENGDEAERWDESFIVGGTSSSTAVVWDVSSGRLLSRLSVFKSRNEQTIVWSSTVLADGTIVLGDSNGSVTFYDPRTRIPLVTGTFKVHGDAADVLALCVGPDGRKVYSASVDQKVAEYTLIGSQQQQQQQGSAGKGKTKQVKWAHTATRRLHAHDIRALAIEPKFDIAAAAAARFSGAAHVDSLPARVPVLVSGGTDFHVVMTPAAASSTALNHARGGKKKASAAQINPISDTPLVSFGETIQRKMAYVPPTSRSSLLGGGSAIQLCAAKRWVVLRRTDSIAIWSLPPSATEDEQLKASFQESNHLGLPPLPMHGSADTQSQQHQWRKLIEMEFKVRTPLVAVSISPDGSYLAISDLYESKLFRLKQTGRLPASTSIEPRRIASFATAFKSARKGNAGGAPGASALTFTPDGRRLILCSYASATVYVVELPAGSNSGGSCAVSASFDLHRRKHAPASKGRQLAGKLRTPTSGDAAAAPTAEEEAEEDTNSEAANKEQVYAVIHHAKISPDGQWLLTMDSLRRAHIFSLDLLSHHKSLPSPQHLPSAIVFHPTDPSLVLMLLPTNRVSIVDIEKGYRDSKRPEDAWLIRFETAIHSRICKIRDPVAGAVWLPPASGSSTKSDAPPLMLFGPNWLVTVTPGSEKLPSGDATQPMINGFKRGHDEHSDASSGESDDDEEHADGLKLNGHASKGKETKAERYYNTKVTFSYQSILLADAIPAAQAGREHEVVIVERPYFSLAAAMPPAYYRGVKYGS